MRQTRQDMKALFSLSTLLNAHSQKVKGFQLFISMMLIARATNKQVYIQYYIQFADYVITVMGLQ